MDWSARAARMTDLIYREVHVSAWLMLYDPTLWTWPDLGRLSEQCLQGRTIVQPWPCGRNRRMRKGERVYFLRKGREPNGIFAAGIVARVPREEKGAAIPGGRDEPVLVIDVALEALLDGNRRVAMPLDQLQREFPAFQWNQRESAAQPLPDAILERLEDVFRQRHEIAVEEEVRSLSPEKRRAQRNEERADPLRLATVGAYFSMFAGLSKGEAGDVEAVLQPVRGMLHREPGFDVKNALCQLAMLAIGAGLPVTDRFPPRKVEDHGLVEAFEAFRRQYRTLLDSLAAGVQRNVGRWPHVEDYRLYWTAPPTPGAMPPAPAHARELRAENLAAAEVFSSAWHASAVDFALAWETARLWGSGQRELATRMERAQRDGIGGEGWDILSFEPDGSPRTIIVKATRFGCRQPFLFCAMELEIARDPERSTYVYRLFDALTAPRFCIVQSRLQQREILSGSQAQGVRLLEWSRLNLHSPWFRRTADDAPAQVFYEYVI